MSDRPSPVPSNPDSERLYAAMSRVTEQSQRIVQAFVERQASSPREFNPLEPAVISKAYQALWQQMLTDPRRLVEAQVSLWQDYAKLWENTARRMAGEDGEDVEPAAAPEPGDRRFKDDAWAENPLYDHIKQSYLLASKFVLSTVREAKGLDAHTAQKVDFYTRPVHRRPRADQLRDDEPRGGPAHGGDGRREPRAGAFEHARGSRARPGPAPDQDDRSREVQAGRERRRHPRQGRLRERPDAAHPSTCPPQRWCASARCSSFRPGSTSSTSWTCAPRTRSSSGRWSGGTPCS